MSVLFLVFGGCRGMKRIGFRGLWLDGGLLGKAGPAACCWDAA